MGDRAVGVVLSGTGSNGSAALAEIKVAGGVVLAQDPATAAFADMPSNAISTGHVDQVFAPAGLADRIAEYIRNRFVAEIDLQAVEEASFNEILELLRTQSRVDLRNYRRQTLVRRINRRVGLKGLRNLQDYVALLRKDMMERDALSQDLMINVTGFFRDPDSWKAMENHVIAPLVHSKKQGSDLRCWVTACSSGEEAYTLAMLLVEHSEAAGKNLDIKVFATDLSDNAIGRARTGVFPAGITSQISSERLARFFEADNDHYRVSRRVRENVVFAPHNLLSDPPFSHLDIATCRSMLIYLEPEIQRKVLRVLHFALRPGGALMLGSSESTHRDGVLFEPLDAKHKIFRRSGGQCGAVADLLSRRGVSSVVLDRIAAARGGRDDLSSVALKEELETSKEELQSLNEKLATVNAQLQNKLDELETTTSNLTNLMKSSDIATLFLSRDMKVKWFTPAVARLFSLIETDIGRPITDFAQKFVDGDINEDCRQVVKSRVPVKKEIRDEGGHWYLRRTTPHRSSEDQIDGIVMTFVDITNIKETQKKLRRAAQKARRAAAAKDIFLARLSHELRTPLQPVLLGLSGIADRTDLPEGVADKLTNITRNLRIEMRLIDDLLDLTRIGEGQLQLELERTDVLELIRESVRMCREESVRRKQTLSITGTPGECMVDADRIRLQQVIWNLLHNAIRFTSEQGIITVGCHCRDGQLLQAAGCRTATAESMNQALRAVTDQEFDLILSDLGLPDGSGYLLIDNLPEDVPVIALSGFGSPQDKQRTANAGFVEHLVKPVTLAELRAAIVRATNGKEQHH